MGFLCYTAQAQIPVTVTNFGTTTPALQPSYTSLALALTDLNLVTAMTGPLTFTLAAGNETAPPAGLTIGSNSLNAVVSATNTVTIINTGNTAILNAGIGAASPTSLSPDGILKLTGADFITLDGLTLTDGNTTNPATMEFGIALFKLNGNDGANNNRIQNCRINMQRINNATGTAPLVDGAVGIGVYNSAAGSATGALVTVSPPGSNSNNQFYTNTINGGNIGIAIIGYAAPSPFTLADQNNDIGGSATGTGNSILNYGGALSAGTPAAGIRTLSQYNLNVGYNTINNNTGAGVNHPNTLRGIYLNTAVSANATVSNNNVTLHGGGTTSQLSAIENVSGSTAAGNTINLNDNVVTGDYLTATSGPFYGIYNTGTPATVNIQNNNISNISYSGAALAGTGTVYPIFNSGAATNVNVLSNMINNISRTGSTGGSTVGISLQAGTNQTVNGNSVSNMSINGTGPASLIYGILITSGTIVCNNNNIFNLACLKTTGTGVLYGIHNTGNPTNENYNNNLVNNLANSGTGNTYGMNTIGTTTFPRTLSGNIVHTISSAGLIVAGINNVSSPPTIFKNKIYNISTSSAGAPTVSGLLLGPVSTTGTANIYNNLIGDIKALNAVTSNALLPSVRGINITTNTGNTNIFLDFNTVYIAGTGGASFGTAALFVAASPTTTTANLTMRNNILVNVSTPAGAGFSAVAYQRSGINLENYNEASNNNLFYSGTPSAANLLFFDGTNADETMSVFQLRVAPRETNSVSFAPAFLSTAGSSSNFLHIDPASPSSSALADAGVTIATITTDFDGQLRSTPPDIGADEFITFGSVVPIAIEYFRGSKLGGDHFLDWKVNSSNEPFVHLSLECSADGRNFKSINDQTATAVRCQQGFSFTDNSPLSGVNYYRLKTTTANGKFKYSGIVALINGEKGFELISISPNPVQTNATLNLSTVKGGIMSVSVSDIRGKIVMTQSVTVIAGNNPINMNFSRLGAGTYNIRVMNAENEIKTTRFVKY